MDAEKPGEAVGAEVKEDLEFAMFELFDFRAEGSGVNHEDR